MYGMGGGGGGGNYVAGVNVNWDWHESALVHNDKQSHAIKFCKGLQFSSFAKFCSDGELVLFWADFTHPMTEGFFVQC